MQITSFTLALVPRSVLCTALLGAVFLCPHTLLAAASKSDVPSGVSATDWQGIRAAHKAWKHEVRAVEGGWEAQNPAQQWTTKFDGRGFVAKPSNADWTWGLELRAYGAGDMRRAATGAPEVKTKGHRLAYHWDDTVQEWFVNDGRGLEHGFSVQERPPGPVDAPLTFVLATRGPLSAKVSADARAVDYRDASGKKVLTYSGLRVWDADGRNLPSRFVPAEGGVELQVDAAGARYPVTIDPLAQQAYLKASNTQAEDFFGNTVSISGDTLVVGAPYEDSAAIGINGNQTDNSAPNSGAVYVFQRTAAGWQQQAYIKASNAEAGDGFGSSVSLSVNTLVVGAPYEDSMAAGINGNQADNSIEAAGAAYVFVRNGGAWSQQAYLKASNPNYSTLFGSSVSFSGSTIVVGSPQEHGRSSGVNGNQAGGHDDGGQHSGAAYVFVRSGAIWSQQAYLKASNNDNSDRFATSVAVFGNTIVVGAPMEDSGASGINGNQADSSSWDAGAAYVFVRVGSAWSQQAYLKASNTEPTVRIGYKDSFGRSVAISGETVVVGAPGEGSAATGVNGDQSNNNANNSGAAYVFVRNNATWSQQAYIKASNTDAGDDFGRSLAISGDRLVVGAPVEQSAATGVNSDQADNSYWEAGAAYVFIRSGATWSQQAYLKASNTEPNSSSIDRAGCFGEAVAVSGETVVVGAPGEESAATGINGDQSDNSAPRAGAVYVFDETDNDANLRSLSVSGATLTPSFSAATLNYAARLGFESSSVTITPTLAQAGATAQVRMNNGAWISVGSGNASSPFALRLGTSSVDVRTISPNGQTSKIYKVVVTRDPGGKPITMDVVTVGDAGNVPDTNGYGAVSNAYSMGRFEVTIGQYTDFLNTVARRSAPAYLASLWNTNMTNGNPGRFNLNTNAAGIVRTGTGAPADPYVYSAVGDSSRPIAAVTWLSAARFCNWLHNGATNGAGTETGAYSLNGFTITNTDANWWRSNGVLPSRNVGAKWWIPTEDEWYKAAYYKGGGVNAGYWAYPTQSDVAPGNAIGWKTNQANVYQTIDDYDVYNGLTAVGSFVRNPGAYSTYDQGGNLAEWNDLTPQKQQQLAVKWGISNSSSWQWRSYRGGFWGEGSQALLSATNADFEGFGWVPWLENVTLGFRVAGQVDANTDLSALAFSGGTVTPAFAPARSSYTAIVPRTPSSVRVIPTAAQANSSINVRVNGGPYVEVRNGTPSAALNLNLGLNKLEVNVTAKKGLTAKTYTLWVGRGSADADLRALALEAGALSPSLNAATTDYSASVANEVASIRLVPTAGQASATIEVSINGGAYTPVASGTPTLPLPLSVGNNRIELKVTAENTMTSKTYVVTVTRGLGSNPNLAGITLSAGSLTPALSASPHYEARVDFATSTITLTPDTVQPGAAVRVRVNGGPYTSVLAGLASSPLALAVGSNLVQIEVTSPNGAATKIYSITVVRAPFVDTVRVGDAGNAPDTNGLGAVATPYSIGKFEVNLGQYAEFLNAVARTNDPYGLYKIGFTGPELMRADVAGISRELSNGVYTYTPVQPVGVNPPGASSAMNRPVAFMTMFNAARFANWLANGRPKGLQDAKTTENGTYALNGAISGAILRNATNPNTGTPPTWWIPTENEWYKAAYYKGGGINAGYWRYPTQSDTRPGNTIGSLPNQANHKLPNSLGTDWTYGVPQVAQALYLRNALTDGGAFGGSASAYGTFDQGGNVWEWCYTSGGDTFPLLGGDCYGDQQGRDFLISSFRNSGSGNSATYSGFRVAGVINTNADLRALVLSSGSLTPAFSPGTVRYGVSLPAASSSVRVRTSAARAGATISVRVNGGTSAPVVSGQSSELLPLNPGPNVLEVRVNEPNGPTSNVYTVLVNRGTLSSDAGLRWLTLSSGSLSPFFAQNTVSYAASVPFSTSTISLLPTPSQADANVQVRVNGGSYSGVAVGGPSQSLPLNIGPNNVEVRVSAPNGTTAKSYAVTVTRAAPSTNADLSALRIARSVEASRDGLRPAFDPNTTSYDAGVRYGSIFLINAKPTAAHPGATIQTRINEGGYSPVSSGGWVEFPAVDPGRVFGNTVEFKVTAEDGLTSRIYRVNVSRVGDF